MTDQGCDRYRDLLPELLHGVLDPGLRQEVETHVAACQGCREEVALLDTLFQARPEAPAGLEDRIQARLEEEFSSHASRSLSFIRRFPPLSPQFLSAAAVLILALGIGVIWNPGGQDTAVDPVLVVLAEDPLPEAWLWDDGVVAGAPVFDGLSDEDLLALLAVLEEEA